jgi:hypothetical protein
MRANDQRLAELERKHGEKWDMWTVPAVVGPTAWCVRPKGAQTATHLEYSSDALDKWMREQ